MENITSAADLKKAIQLLEAEHDLKGQILKERFNSIYESLKPINLLKSTINEISSSPYLINNILGTTVALATGYFSKKAIIGSSGNILKKLFGTILQFGITNLIARNPADIKSLSQFIFHRIFHKKDVTPEEQ